MKKLMKKRTGFTLVELLIVIIIIGILAGAMLLVAGSGTDKAEATKIVSNLRSAKSASLLRWADDGNWNFFTDGTEVSDALLSYMDRELPTTYKFSNVTSGDSTVYAITTKNPSTGVGAKLAAIGKDSGLYTDTLCTKILEGASLAESADIYMRVK